MSTPESSKKKSIITALVILSIPVLFVSVRLFMSERPGTQQTLTATGTQQTKPLHGAEEAHLTPAHRNPTEQTSHTPGSTQQNVIATTPALAPKNGAGSNVATAKPQSEGFFSRLFGGFGLSKTTPPAPGTPSRDTASLNPIHPSGTLPSTSLGTSLSGSSDAAKLSQNTPPPAPPEPTEGCVTETFRHKKTAGHSTEEACAQHRNLVRLKHSNIAQICIRVNGTPVAHQPVKGKTNEFIIGPSAGPRAVITARYCFGKTNCQEDCSVPKDDFMAAIGGNDEGKQVAQWDSSDAANKDGDATAHMDADMKKDLEHLDDKPAEELFADWIGGSELPACGTKHAMN